MRQKQFIMTILICIVLFVEMQEPVRVFAAGLNSAVNSTYMEDAIKGMKKVADNDLLELYFDEAETTVAVRNKRSNALWFSNPVDTEEDNFSTSYYQKVLKSQLYLTYIDEDTTVSTMNNYDSSIINGQFETEEIEDGVRITYFIGDSALMIRLPEAISEERMLSFLEKMSSSEQKKIKRNYTLYSLETLEENKKDDMLKKYPALSEQDLYVLRSGTKDYMREELAGYFEEAGYTQEDFELDSENSDDGGDDGKPWFRVPLNYQLDGDTLVVTLDPEEIEYNSKGYYLVNIDILRYFGASLNDDGYIFVPDGCGALINFNNGKTREASYAASVYGQDETFVYNTWYQSQVDAVNTIKMPVYGIKDGNKAMLALIEEGDAYATINADIAGKYTGYNNVYASYTFLQYGATSLSDMVGAQSYYMYSGAEFEGSYKIRYFFLDGDTATYSGMASRYREYLVAKGVLGSLNKADELPFYAEYIGAIDKPKTFLGIKYDAVEPLTTFAQAKEITEMLRKDGVNNLNVIYSGWMNGGLHGTAATQMNIESKLKNGGISFAELQRYMDSENVDLSMTLDLQYVYDDEPLDGYSTIQYAPRYFDNAVIKINEYGLASRVTVDELANLISPYYVNKIAQTLVSKLTRQGINGINMGTLTWELYSDLQPALYTDRQMAERENMNAMQTFWDNGKRLTGDNANAYSFPFLSEMINAPMSSNHYRIIDEEVPFYEMVIHGYIPYAGSAMNLTDDYTTSVLKSVEYGAGMYFKWIYAKNSILKETDYDYLYSVNYAAWLSQAVSDYAQMNKELGYLAGYEIVSHEYIMRDVAKVTYSDGSSVYVNYTKDSVTVDGFTVPERSYVVKKGAS